MLENELPLCVFPEKVQKIVEDLRVNMKFPVEYVAGSILFSVSVVVGGNKKLRTRLGDTYANIFVALVGPQGSGKSRPVEWATQWMRQHDIRAMEHILDSLPPGAAMSLCPRFLVGDITPEALAQKLMENPGGVGQHVDELCKLVSDIGRYNNSRNEDMLLTLFSGGSLIVDRKKEKRPIALARTYFSLIGTVQPARYVTEFVNKRFDSGLYGRFAPFCKLDNPPIIWELDDDLPADLINDYNEILKNIADGREEEVTYTLSSDARNHIQMWQNDRERQLFEIGREFEVAIFRKCQIYVFKFALILEILWNSCDGNDNPTHEVSMKSAVYATMLTDYCYNESVDLVLYNRHATLSATEQKVYDSLQDHFTTKEGLALARRNGMSRSAFFAMLDKIKGILIEQRDRGLYVKKNTAKEINILKPRPFS